MPGAVPDVHVAGGAPACCSASTTRIYVSRRAVVTSGWCATSGGSRFEGRRARYERNSARVRRTTVALDGGVRLRAAQALRRPEVRLAQLAENGAGLLSTSCPASGISIWRAWKRSSSTRDTWTASRRPSPAPAGRRACPSRRDFRYAGVPGLSREIVERLTETRPATLGQARRVPGVTPAAVTVIAAYVARRAGRGRRLAPTHTTRARRAARRWRQRGRQVRDQRTAAT